MRGHFLRDKSGFLLPFTAAAVNGYKPIDGNGTVVVFLETTYRTLQVLVLRGKLSSESAFPPPLLLLGTSFALQIGNFPLKLVLFPDMWSKFDRHQVYTLMGIKKPFRGGGKLPFPR